MFFLKYHCIMMFKLDEIIEASGAELVKNTSDSDDFQISTDTRKIKKGELYLPLKGASFDGEDFLAQAVEKGAEGCFITGEYFPDDANIVLKVKDTLSAYLALAGFLRRKVNPVTVAITGSSGKTTTKEIVYSVLCEKFKTHKTFSNHNNEIGFCETLMNMPQDCDVLIIEMGMRGAGEIELLSRYSEPDFAIITNAGTAHIGRLGSLDNIAKAKCEIVRYLKKDGTFIGQDNQRIKKFIRFDGEKIYYSLKDAEIVVRKPAFTKFLYKGKEYELNVEGDYNVENALSAINLGFKLGMSYEEIHRGLAAYRPIEKRWEMLDAGGYKIINDSYNANPDSMKAAVSTFLRHYRHSVVVLGDMGELGVMEDELHIEVGRYIAGLDYAKDAKYLTVGRLARQIGLELKAKGFFVKNFENNQQVVSYIIDSIDVGTTIFLKASRSMKFEEIIEQLKGEIKV